MHAVVTSLTFIDRGRAEAELAEIMQRVSRMPGFVSGYWVALSGDLGTSMIIFDSREAADTLASFAERAPYATVTPREISVGEVIGHAGTDGASEDAASSPGCTHAAGPDDW